MGSTMSRFVFFQKIKCYGTKSFPIYIKYDSVLVQKC